MMIDTIKIFSSRVCSRENDSQYEVISWADRLWSVFWFVFYDFWYWKIWITNCISMLVHINNKARLFVWLEIFGWWHKHIWMPQSRAMKMKALRGLSVITIFRESVFLFYWSCWDLLIWHLTDRCMQTFCKRRAFIAMMCGAWTLIFRWHFIWYVVGTVNAHATCIKKRVNIYHKLGKAHATKIKWKDLWTISEGSCTLFRILFVVACLRKFIHGSK